MHVRVGAVLLLERCLKLTPVLRTSLFIKLTCQIPFYSDTAHRVHPLAGQGVSLGLGDVATLTSCLLKANSKGADWGRYISIYTIILTRTFLQIQPCMHEQYE